MIGRRRRGRRSIWHRALALLLLPKSVWERGAACSQEEVADGLGPAEVRLHVAGL